MLPAGGDGQVLVTSRWSAWSAEADPVQLDVFDRAESVRYLQRRIECADSATLGELAELVGDLPLALAESAAYVEQTQIGLADYLDLLRNRAAELFGLASVNASGLDSGEADRRRVATVWSVSLDQIRARAPAAESLMALYAFLAPAIPRNLPGEHAEALPAPLAQIVTDPLAYNAILRVLGEFSMVVLDPTTLVVHRLVQAVVRARLDSAEERKWAVRAIAIIRARFPDDSADTSNWPEYERLLPHLLVVADHGERLAVSGVEVGWLLNRASTYQRERGQYSQALPLARRALAVTSAALGPDDVEVAWRHDELGSVLWALGDLTAARDHHECAVQIGEAALGPGHRYVGTWRSNLGLALQDLGALAEARVQYEKALQIKEATIDADHREMGHSYNNLGSVLHALGDLLGARTQLEHAVQIGESILGPPTRTSASGTTTWAGSCKIWETSLVPALSSNAPCTSANPSWAPTILTSQSALATLAACSEIWGTWPRPPVNSNAPYTFTNSPSAPATHTSASGATTSAAYFRTWENWPKPVCSTKALCRLWRPPSAPTTRGPW